MTSHGTIRQKQPSNTSAVPWKPHAYQLKAVKHLLQRCAAGLFLDPGLGKTSVVLAAFKVLLQNNMAERMLVIAPLRVVFNVWPAEINHWTDFNGLRYRILHNDAGDKDDSIQEDADIYIINPDGLEWLFRDPARFRKLRIDTLVIDESTKFKRTTTRRFKLLRPHLSSFKRRWILTGSPNPNSYLDLFGQIYICDLGNALGPFITHYRQEFFYPSGFGGYEWKLNPGAEALIQKRIKPLVLRLDAEDYIKMPKPVPNPIRVELPATARKVYNDMEEQMIAQLDELTTVTAFNAAVASGKCAQIANGGLYVEGTERRLWKNLHDAKTEALVDLVEELQGSPLLVAYEFEHDVDRIKRMLGSVPVIGGGTTMKLSERYIDQWNAGELPVLLGHPDSMGHGLNMQYSNCHNVCFYGITWNYELYDQMIRRVRRQGNASPQVIIHHIIATNTVDEAKMQALQRKEKGQRGLLDALRTYVKSRRKR